MAEIGPKVKEIEVKPEPLPVRREPTPERPPAPALPERELIPA